MNDETNEPTSGPFDPDLQERHVAFELVRAFLDSHIQRHGPIKVIIVNQDVLDQAVQIQGSFRFPADQFEVFIDDPVDL